MRGQDSAESRTPDDIDKNTRAASRTRRARRDLVALRGGLDASGEDGDAATGRAFAGRAADRSARRAARAKRSTSTRRGFVREVSVQEAAFGDASVAYARPAVFTAAVAAEGRIGRVGSAGRSARSRAQEDASEPSSVRDALSERVSELRVSPLPLLLLGALVVALAVVIVVGPVRMYYAAWRDEGILDAQYEVVAAQYEELSGEVSRLQTTEGIEEAARKRGYVYPDEEALVVTGLDEEQPSEAALMEESVAEHEANLPWYVQLLDALFGYQHSYR